MIVKFQGAQTFLLDSAHRLVFAVNANNTVSEINGSTNSVINSSYFVLPSKGYSITTSFLSEDGTLFVSASNANTSGFQPNIDLYPQTTYVIQPGGRLIDTIDTGYSALLFATQSHVYFANPIQNFSLPATITILDRNLNFVKNISDPNCVYGCRYTGAFFDPVNNMGYVVELGVGADGGHGWEILPLNTSTNAFVGQIYTNYPSSFSYDQKTGIAYMSNAWDEGHLSCCTEWVTPGANVTVLSGASALGQIEVNQDAAPTTYGQWGTNSSGGAVVIPGFFPSESGENDTLGSVAFDSTSGTLYVANGNFTATFQYQEPTGQPSLHSIVAISSPQSSNPAISVLATYPNQNISAIFYDPVNGELYVSFL